MKTSRLSRIVGKEFPTTAARSAGAFDCPTRAAIMENSHRALGGLRVEKLETVKSGENMEDAKEDEREIICAYTRREALADGLQVDVSKLAAEAGIGFPVFVTRSVLDKFVNVPLCLYGQDESRRLWDVVCMLLYTLQRPSTDIERMGFELYGRSSTEESPKWVQFLAEFGPLDFDDPRQAITIMLADED